MNDWFPLIIGLAGAGAAVYGTRSTRKTAQEASAETGIRETLKTAVEVNQITYEALAMEQRKTIEKLETQVETLIEKIEQFEGQVEEQKETIDKLRRQLEEADHGPLAS